MPYFRPTWRNRVLTTGVLFATSFSSTTVAENEIHWLDIAQVCGRISTTEPTKKTIRTIEGKVEVRENETPIKLVHLTLSNTENQTSQCCTKVQLVRETASGRSGDFGFSGNGASYYWLLGYLKDWDVQIPLQAKKYDKSRCEDKLLIRILFVDAEPFPRVEVRIL